MKLISVEVTGITVYQPYQGYMVILKEQNSNRWLPIFIGPAEARNISLLLNGQQYQRPLTFDMFHDLLKTASIKVKNVTITELRDSTFFAEVYLQSGTGELKPVDARPSDAIALALKAQAQIFVASQVMDEAGLVGEMTPPDKDDIGDHLRELNNQLQVAVDKEAYEEAAKIRDKIRNLEEQVRSS